MCEKVSVDLSKLKFLYETQDRTNLSIAKELGCSESTLVRLVRIQKYKKFDKYSYISKEVLEDLYVKQNMTMLQIANEMKTNKGVIQYRVEKFKLKKSLKVSMSKATLDQLIKEGKSFSEIACLYSCSESSVRKKYKEDFKQGYKPKIPYEDLYKMYIIENKSQEEIGKYYGYSEASISRFLKFYNIKKEQRYNLDRELLKNMYLLENKSTRRISKELQIPESFISRELKDMGIVKKGKYAYVSKNVVKDLYINKKYSISEICKLLDCPTNVIHSRVYAYNLKEATQEMNDEDYNFNDLTSKRNLLEGSLNIEKATKEELYNLFKLKKLTKTKISKIYRCSIFSVQRVLEKWGLLDKVFKIPNEDLKRLYINENKTQRQIAKIYHVSISDIVDQLRSLGVHKKTKYEDITEDILRELYIKEGLNAIEIGQKLEVNQVAISKKIQKLGLNKERDSKVHKESLARSRKYALSKFRSDAEKELESLYPTPFLNIHSVIGRELDLYYPDKKVAIEFNGDYWHSDIHGYDVSHKHVEKMKLCKEKGIHLVNIFERFWHSEKSKRIILNILDNLLNSEKLKEISGILVKLNEEDAKHFIKGNNLALLGKETFI